MNELKIFENSKFGEIRSILIDGEPWFVGKDVAIIFGDTNYRRSLARLDEDEKGVSQIATPGGMQEMTIINESGLYSLLFYMQPQKAKGVSQNDALIDERISKLKKFKRWVTSEVLPAIRKTGKYESSPILARELTTDDYMEAARTVSKCHNSRLPIVLDLYKKAGFDIPKLPKSDRDELVDRVVELLSRQSLRKSEKILGISRAVLGRYRNRIYKPSVERCRFIIERLDDSHV